MRPVRIEVSPAGRNASRIINILSHHDDALARRPWAGRINDCDIHGDKLATLLNYVKAFDCSSKQRVGVTLYNEVRRHHARLSVYRRKRHIVAF